MTLLLDTCVISEAIKPRGNMAVQQWLSNQPPTFLCISALTIGELYYGARLKEGQRRQELESWVATVRRDFEGRILPLDESVAARWGQLRVHHPNAHIVDTQIAATALVYGFTVVTRNVRDFSFPGLEVFNPWPK